MPLTTIQLMHLADSSLPVGGFAFSNGLEAAVTCGMVASQESLERYLQTAIKQWHAFEVPFLHDFFAGITTETAHRYDCMMLSPSMRKASFAQGRGWLRLFGELFPGADLNPIRKQLRDMGIGPHYLPIFTASLQSVGATEDQVREVYLFTLLRDQTSAAVRLGLIGPAAAQALQSRLEQELTVVNQNDSRPKRFTPLMDLAQMLQPALYTKLFQN